MNRILCTLYVVAAVAACRGFSGAAQFPETNIFQWATRPQLTPDQPNMLQLQKSVEITREDSPLHTEDQAKLAALKKKLGSLSVRTARANELTLSRISTNVCTIHNPTDEGLMLTISVIGDFEQLGSRTASISRDTYFPPGSTIVVTNLYWTTPSTEKRRIR